MRLAIDFTLWVALRHFAIGLCSRFLVPGIFPMWCQAGRLSLCFWENLGASSSRLCFAPVCRISQMLFGRVLLVYCCLWYTVCRKMSDMIFTSVSSTRDFGMLPMMIAMAASEAMGLDSE